MKFMNRIPVSSSDLASVGYDPDTQILEIEFNTGSIYQYSNVPQIVHEGLMSAPSCGQYFHREVKDSYGCNKVG